LYLRLDRRRKNKCDARASTNQREQYGGTVHIFIGTGRSLCEITFILFSIDYTNYHGSICLFIFKSVQPFVLGMSLCRSSLEGSFGVISVLIFRRCFFLQDLRLRSKPPTKLIQIMIFLIRWADRLVIKKSQTNYKLEQKEYHFPLKKRNGLQELVKK
jgi:hypothetical protein